MSDAHYLLPTSVDLHQSLVQPRMRLLQPIRNSAPSRLENFENFYWGNMSSSDPNSTGKPKANSLTNLFVFEKLECTEKHNGNCPFISNNSLTSSDSSEPSASPISSPSSTSPVFSSTRTDTNSNGLNDFCSGTTTSNAVPALKEAESHSFHGNGHNGSMVHNRSEKATLSQLIRKDTFDIANLSLNGSKIDKKTDATVKTSPQVELVVKHSVLVEQKVTEEPQSPQDTGDKESISSSSSDETFVGDDENDDKTASKPAGYFRSLSDSTVHHNRKARRELLKRRKSVHFADSSGYELEVHIPICQGDDYETPPRLMEALQRLRTEARGRKNAELERQRGGFNTLLRHFSLVLNFQQPFLEPTFQSRITRQHVCLESVSILPNSLSFTGVVRVSNLEFEKHVTVRYSVDNWRTYIDIPACYVSSFAELRQDQFSFHVVATDSIMDYGKIQLAFRYRLPLSRREFWDNNYGRNYTISCLEHRGNHCDDEMMT